MKPVNESVAQKGHRIILKWIAESYRPLSIVEDPGFVQLCAFTNAFSTITRLLNAQYNDTVIAVKAMVAEECEHYSLTCDVWSYRACQAYILLMVHYLTEDFNLKVVTLRCAPFSNVRHTGIGIRWRIPICL